MVYERPYEYLNHLISNKKEGSLNHLLTTKGYISDLYGYFSPHYTDSNLGLYFTLTKSGYENVDFIINSSISYL